MGVGGVKGVGGIDGNKLSGVPVPVHAVLLHWWANYQQTKPCRLLGGFSGEAGETTIVTGEEALASESPVGKDSSQRGAIQYKILRHILHTRKERGGETWLVPISLCFTLIVIRWYPGNNENEIKHVFRSWKRRFLQNIVVYCPSVIQWEWLWRSQVISHACREWERDRLQLRLSNICNSSELSK